MREIISCLQFELQIFSQGVLPFDLPYAMSCSHNFIFMCQSLFMALSFMSFLETSSSLQDYYYRYFKTGIYTQKRIALILERWNYVHFFPSRVSLALFYAITYGDIIFKSMSWSDHVSVLLKCSRTTSLLPCGPSMTSVKISPKTLHLPSSPTYSRNLSDGKSSCFLLNLTE